MNVPDNLKYTQDHEWVRLEADGTVLVGITDFAQSNLGDIVYVDISTVGKTVAKNEVFGTVEAVKTVADLFMPIDGEVIAFNTHLDTAPESVNSDPYSDGWMVRVRPTHAADVAGLMSAADYAAHTA